MTHQSISVRDENPTRIEAGSTRLGWWVAAAGAAYAVATSWLVMRKLSSFIALGDIHSFENILWNTCRGRVLYWGAVGTNSLGDHVSPTLALLAPIYALWQHPATLIVAQRILMAVAALLVYKLASHVLDSPPAGALLGVASLLYPPMHGANLECFSPILMSVPLLLWTFLCYETRRFRWMWLALLLSIGVKENVPLVLAGFGLYIALFRGDRKRGLIVLGLAVVWFLLSVRVIMPGLSQEAFDVTWTRRLYGPTIGGTMGEALWHIVRHPLRTIGIALQPMPRMHLVRLFAGLCLLPLAAPGALLCALPIIAMNVLSTPEYGMASTLSHTHAAALPGLFYAAIYGIRRVSQVVPGRQGATVLSVAVLLCCAVWLPLSEMGRQQVGFSWAEPYSAPPMPPARRAVARRLMERVPSRAFVLCSLNLANHMAGRPAFLCDVRDVEHLRERQPKWVLLDMQLGAVEGIEHVVADLDKLEAFLAEAYECIERDAAFVLLRRREAGAEFRFSEQEFEAYIEATWERARGRHMAEPHRADLLRDAAMMLVQTGRVAEAVGLLEKDIPRAEPKAYLHTLLGLCYRELGESQKARAAWRRALEIDPENRTARKLLEEKRE